MTMHDQAGAEAYAKAFVKRETDAIFNKIAGLADEMARTATARTMTGPDALRLFADSIRKS